MRDSIGDPPLIDIITNLKSQKGEYVSGQTLSRSLGISRVAIWHHVKRLRRLGYKIESKRRHGYKLIQTTKLPLPWEITAGLPTKVIGKHVYFFRSLDSTQNYALRISPNPKEDGSVIISQKQTRGRGRLGRKWISPSGGLWLSIILHPKFDVSVLTLFPLAAALALAHAIYDVLKIRVSLKWPNDLLLDKKKVAGILTDADIESNKVVSLVLGVGINFNINSRSVQRLIQKTDNYQGVTSLDSNNSSSPILLLQKFFIELERLYELLKKNDTNYIIKNWSKYSSTLGQRITVTSNGKKITGKAIKIDNDGSLIVKVGRTNIRIVADDIQHSL